MKHRKDDPMREELSLPYLSGLVRRVRTRPGHRGTEHQDPA